MEGMIKCSANYVPLTPISFLERSAIVYRDRVSVIYGDVKYTWKETHERCIRLASALAHLGISPGDVVAALAPNIPAMYELHFGVPMAGAVLCTLNVRHDSSMVSVLLKHSEAKLVFVDYQFLSIAQGALEILQETKTKLPLLVLISECGQPAPISSPGILEYESLLATGKLDFEVRWPKDEWDPISLNYTSGTTSSPKGVIYSHRGAYLNSFAAILLNEMSSMPVYLWCVPMFHCNGWCLTWAVAAQGGTNVCQRDVTAKHIFENIAQHKVTHLGGAPTVLNMIINASARDRKPLPGKVSVMTGGAPPPSHVLFKMEELGFHVIHAYGLTETYGPGTVCTWKPEWASLPRESQAKIKARQGVQHLGLEELDIKDPVTMKTVPADAKTMGEVMFRGNTVMNGYLKNLKATKDAFSGGWFRSGDLGVKHPDGYIELKDRSKDIIISGGENISSIEVESVLFSHPAVLEAAIVGRPDDYWGETPCAFVKLKDGCNEDSEELIKFCRDHLPHYMAPRTVVFQELPKTSTGKVQKFVLKEKAKAMGSIPKGNIMNVFECGGVAIGICISHLALDGAALSTFLKAWSAIAKGSKEAIIYPEFIPTSLFPANDLWLRDSAAVMFGSLFKKGNGITKRFVFDASAISSLRARAAGVECPTRVEVVSSFLWKCFMAASEEWRGCRRPSLLTHLVNLRRKMEPKLAENSVGNFLWLAAAKCMDKSGVELNDLVGEVRRAISKIDADFVEQIKGDKRNSMAEQTLREIGSPTMNLVILADTRCDGVEAFVSLNEKEMAILEGNPELLKFASLNPSPLDIDKSVQCT
ncbi:ACYL-ACTIVATING ENZYME 2-RELATED [Salix purpurea]|uniref:ACYL-ACTIVATING ENZYME 2-RELATED n=1 Tax=Salix purpurea TaxID=77065 RepID=A0A9Q0SPH5_SALPP|nr:ACYL-ACTIVATING ENZYME 2-RELATED [Salix purpurea]